MSFQTNEPLRDFFRISCSQNHKKHSKFAHFSTKNGYFLMFCGPHSHKNVCKLTFYDHLSLGSYYFINKIDKNKVYLSLFRQYYYYLINNYQIIAYEKYFPPLSTFRMLSSPFFRKVHLIVMDFFYFVRYTIAYKTKGVS